jgi:hypothetical protein
MPGTTNVPSIVFTPTGLTLPSDTAILAGVQADMNAAFGGNLNPDLATPQGQLASSQSAILSAKNAEFAKFVNQIDPATADGFMQDAIARIYFLNRRPASSTVVQVTCTGLAGVVIPLGALVQDAGGNLYDCTQAGVIGVGGTVALQFAAVVPGPTPCPIGTIAGSPYRTISGWDRAENLSDGVLGELVETRAEFEYRRRQSVAINGKGTLPSIYANVFNVDGVIDVYAAENVTNAPINVGSTAYTMTPHSIYIAVIGGVAADIAKAIWERKDAGADYNGNTTVSITDDSGYSYPYPTYNVKFQIPAAKPILFAVQLANSTALPFDIVTQVKNAIIAAFSGADGGQRARIGATIFASRFYAPVTAISPAVSILSLLIGTVTPTLPSVAIGIDQAPTVTAANITVTLV